MKHLNLTFIFSTWLATVMIFGIGAPSALAQTEATCRSTYDLMLKNEPTRPDIAAALGKSFLSQGCGKLFPTVVEPIKQLIAAVEKQAAPATTTQPVKQGVGSPSLAQATYKVGDKAEVLWSGTWYKAQILEAKDGAYKIRYDGYDSKWDEWVKPDRMRAVGGQNSQPSKPTGSASKGLKVGGYACTGSGGRMMIGLGFKVISGNDYTDLDGKRRGTFTITGGTVKFSGGHLEGITGRDLHDNWFTVGAQASCGPY